jgi:WD40 repeat protein
MGSNGAEIRSAGALPGDPLAVIPGASGAMIGTLEGEVLLLNAGGDVLDKTVFDPERGSSSGVATGLARGEQWLLCGGRGAVRLLGVQKAKFDDVASARMSHDDGACGSVTWPEAHRIVIGTALGRLVELDVPSLAVRRSVVVREGEWLVAAAASSRLLAFGTDSGRIVVVNSSSLDLIADWRGHGARISALAFDESEGRLWSTAWDGSVSWWDVAELGQ